MASESGSRNLGHSYRSAVASLRWLGWRPSVPGDHVRAIPLGPEERDHVRDEPVDDRRVGPDAEPGGGSAWVAAHDDAVLARILERGDSRGGAPPVCARSRVPGCARPTLQHDRPVPGLHAEPRASRACGLRATTRPWTGRRGSRPGRPVPGVRGFAAAASPGAPRALSARRRPKSGDGCAPADHAPRRRLSCNRSWDVAATRNKKSPVDDRGIRSSGAAVAAPDRGCQAALTRVARGPLGLCWTSNETRSPPLRRSKSRVESSSLRWKK